METNTNGGGPANEYTLQLEPINTNLDPELQKILVDLRSGESIDSALREALTSGAVMIDVVAKLQDPDAEIDGFTPVQKIGPIVTGMVEIDRISDVRTNENVISLKAAKRVRRMVSSSVPEVHGSRQQILVKFSEFFTEFGPVDGSDVIVGIVDVGCDFAHRHFRKPDGSTRLLYLWDQVGGLADESPEDYGYGREFNADALNNALLTHPPTPANPRAPHDFLGYEIRAPHGTRVMDIAAGNGSDITPPGVAPGADLIFVDVSLGDELEDSESFGNSRHLVEAVKYIFDKAQELGKRAVVNLSLNYDAGPHDGSTPVEEAFDLLLEVPGRAIVIAAGNSRGLHRHARKTIHPRQTSTIGWEIHTSDQTTNKSELWYSGKHELELMLVSPRQQKVGPFPLNSAFTINRNAERAAQVFHRRMDSANQDNHIVLVFTPRMEEGVWTLVLSPRSTDLFAPFDVHAWIETDNGVRSEFIETDADDSYTIGVISCGQSTIAVGSYDVFDPSHPDERSSEGPTRDGRQKPEVSAPGVNVRAASPLTTLVAPDSGGTSNAAPHVTGLIALLMQDAVRPTSIDETRDVITGSVRRNPPLDTSVWDPRYGRGRIDVAQALCRQRRLIRPLTPPAFPGSIEEESLAALSEHLAESFATRGHQEV